MASRLGSIRVLCYTFSSIFVNNPHQYKGHYVVIINKIKCGQNCIRINSSPCFKLNIQSFAIYLVFGRVHTSIINIVMISVVIVLAA